MQPADGGIYVRSCNSESCCVIIKAVHQLSGLGTPVRIEILRTRFLGVKSGTPANREVIVMPHYCSIALQ